MIVLGKALNVSPMQLEHIVRGYLGTMGIYVLMGADSLVGDPTFGETPDLRIDEYPVIRRFYKQKPFRSTQLETDFYDFAQRVQIIGNTLRKMETEGRSADQTQYLSKPDVLAAEALEEDVSLVRNELTRINKAIQLISTDRNLSGPTKRKEINRLLMEKNEVLRVAAKFTSPANVKALEDKLKQIKR
jgi:hypothetical protein